MPSTCAGLPISTTQTITGGLLAVGLFEGLKGVNWRQVAKIFSGWVRRTRPSCAATLHRCMHLTEHGNINAASSPAHQQHPAEALWHVQVATLFIACGLAAGFTAWGVNSPERRGVDAQLYAQEVRVLLASFIPSAMLNVTADCECCCSEQQLAHGLRMFSW